MARRRNSEENGNSKLASVQSFLANRRSKKASLDSLRNKGSVRRSLRSFNRKRSLSGQSVPEDSVIPDFPKSTKPGPLNVLPDEFVDWVESSEILPYIVAIPPAEIYGFLAKIFGINDYEFNSLSFTFIETIRQMLYIAQENMKMTERSQKYFVAWYAHLLYLIKANNWKTDEAYEEICKRFNPSINEQDLLELGIPIPSHLADGRALNSKKHLDLYNPDTSESKNISILILKIFGNRLRTLVHRNIICGDFEVECKNLRVQFPKQYKPYLAAVSLLKVEKATTQKKEEIKEEKQPTKRGKKSEEDEEVLILHNYDETSEKERASQGTVQMSRKPSKAGSTESHQDEEPSGTTMEEKLLHDAEMRVKYKHILPLKEAVDEEFFRILFPDKVPEMKKKSKAKNKK